MYRICFFLCIMNTMAFDDSDEAKYIDLLPEAEKQEFLNRIARRILEEIQSKDSPEQSQAEVTDDQLRVHDAYVQDILKEESEHHRKETRSSQKEKHKEEGDNEDLKIVPLAKASDKHSMLEISKNRDDIDLTLRNEKEGIDQSTVEDQTPYENVDINESIPSDIPVKVVYDAHNNHTGSLINTLKNSTTRADDTLSTNFGRRERAREGENLNNQYNNSEIKQIITKTKELNASPVDYIPYRGPENVTIPDKNSISFNITTTVPTIAISNLITYKNKYSKKENDSVDRLQASEEQGKHNSNNQDQVSIVNKSGEKEDNEYSIDITSTDSNKVKTESENFLATTDSFIDLITVSEGNLGDVEHTTMKRVMKVNNYTIVRAEKNHSITSPIVFDLTTLRSLSTPVNLNKQYEMNRDIKLIRDAENSFKETKAKTNKSEGNNNRKKYLRKRLDILSEGYSFQKVEPYKSNINREQQENKNNKQHLVYKVSEEKPPLAAGEKHEEPYYVPIHNFAPQNAYYNAHNLLGPNNDDNLTAIQRSTINNDAEVYKEDLYALSDLKIDLLDKNHQYTSNTKRQYSYLTEYHGHSPRSNLKNFSTQFTTKIKDPKTKDDPKVDIDYFFDRNLFIRNNKSNDAIEIKRNGMKNYRQLKNIDIDYYLYKSIYDEMGRRSKKAKKDSRKEYNKANYNDGQLPNSRGEDHPYSSIHKGNMENHVRAVRKLLFRQKKFGFMSPTPYAVKAVPMHKRIFADGTDLTSINNDLVTGRTEKNDLFNIDNQHNVAMDYYWGRFMNVNETNKADFHDHFVEFDELPTESIEYKKVHQTPKKLKVELHPRSPSDIVREDAQTSEDNLDNALDAMVNVLRDMIHRDQSYLLSYDWLMSTVDIAGALKKLRDLTENVENRHHINPLDLKLFKYIIYLYDTANNLLENNIESGKNIHEPSSHNLQHSNNFMEGIVNLLRKIRTLPKGKNRRPGEKIKDPLNLWRTWYKYYIRIQNKEYNKRMDILRRFKRLLDDLGDNLYDLHNAIRHIALITTYKTQTWYYDLKNIYLKSASKKQLLQVLLHLSTAKLISAIEGSAKNAAEDYVFYVKDNREVIRNIQRDFVFVLEVLEGIKKRS